MAFDRSAFLAAAAGKFPKEEIDLPALGGSVFVRTMSAGERDRFEEVHAREKNHNYRARLAVATVCDDKGEPVFTPDDIPALSSLPSHLFDPILEVAHRLNGFSGEAREDARKNSESGQPTDSPAA